MLQARKSAFPFQSIIVLYFKNGKSLELTTFTPGGDSDMRSLTFL